MPVLIATVEPITFKRGDSWPAVSFDINDESNQPIPLAGVKILMQVKKKAKDETALQEFTDEDGLIVDLTANTATIDSENAPNDLLAGSYVYDVQWTLTNGIKRTAHEGPVTILQDVSR
jgi:hypothetical protein